MLKNDFQTELRFTTTVQRGDVGPNVRRVQEWLCLNALRFPNASLITALDSDFGPATQQAVRNFQRAIRVPRTGIVTPALFAELCRPMATAFQTAPTGTDVRKAVVQIAQLHLKQRAAELQTDDAQNLGPWVRAYCDSNDGSPFKWCVGFLQAVLDQVASVFGRRFTDIMPQTLSCDILAQGGQANGRLTRSATLRNNPGRIKPGDVFLIRNPANNDWFHAGLIISRSGDVIETIEGNTDSRGSNNGTAVFARVRNFQNTTIDLYSIESL
ncbi:peptidoglycan-binding domain-containing protein [Spirosoma montaniterrae]|uniref:Peptidoglycan-binding protein n=1 Tax=Spirosoma montaniterrae TaxID=1178516 RepID=A0A1P9WX03_9BACT|nr:peptidoglycan-binding domain-containing protein [Spirosoma montaniterrae]AQG79927.1 peptidoglycan-binding protein [Spirosoma montaniterrae]